MKKNPGKLVSMVLITVMMVMLVPSTVSFAATTSLDSYIFVPVVEGADAAELFYNVENSTKTTAADISNDLTHDFKDAVINKWAGGNGVFIDFPALTAADEDTTYNSGGYKPRTSVNVDLSVVKEHTKRYVKFDLTTDSWMDLIMSFDDYAIYDTNGQPNQRPHQLYLVREPHAGLSVMKIAPRLGYGNNANETAHYKNNTLVSAESCNKGWTVSYEPEKTYSIVMIQEECMGLSDKTGDTVSVYVDGVRRGNITNMIDTVAVERNCELEIHHFATADKDGSGNKIYDQEQQLKLQNLEIGYCTKNIPVPTQTLDANATEWTIPEGNNTFVQLTLPTTSTTAWHVTTNDNTNWAALWGTEYGALFDRSSTHFNENGTLKTAYSDIFSWYDQPTWKNAGDEVVLTVEVNETFRTLEMYTNAGQRKKVYYGTRPTKVIFTNKLGNTKPISVVSGDCVYKGFSLANEKGVAKSSFTAGAYMNVCAFNKTEPNRDLMVLYAFYNADNACIGADFKNIKSDADGLYALTAKNELGEAAPSKATKAKAFIWDAKTFSSVVNKPVEILLAE